MLHVIVLPGALGALFAYHMWRVRKDGGLARADREALLAEKRERAAGHDQDLHAARRRARHGADDPRHDARGARTSTVNAVPDLTRRAAIVVLGTIAVVSILARFVRSPLEEAANALVTPNPAKAPWYFLWLQEIVTDTTFQIGSFTINGAFVGGVLLPGLLVGAADRSGPGSTGARRAAAGVWFAADPPHAERSSSWRSCLRRDRAHAHRHVLRGPYWHLYWPWQTWPEIPTRI